MAATEYPGGNLEEWRASIVQFPNDYTRIVSYRKSLSGFATTAASKSYEVTTGAGFQLAHATQLSVNPNDGADK